MGFKQSNTNGTVSTPDAEQQIAPNGGADHGNVDVVASIDEAIAKPVEFIFGSPAAAHNHSVSSNGKRRASEFDEDEEDDEDDDGPETDVDAVDEALQSPLSPQQPEPIGANIMDFNAGADANNPFDVHVKDSDDADLAAFGNNLRDIDDNKFLETVVEGVESAIKKDIDFSEKREFSFECEEFEKELDPLSDATAELVSLSNEIISSGDPTHEIDQDSDAEHEQVVHPFQTPVVVDENDEELSEVTEQEQVVNPFQMPVVDTHEDHSDHGEEVSESTETKHEANPFETPSAVVAHDEEVSETSEPHIEIHEKYQSEVDEKNIPHIEVDEDSEHTDDMSHDLDDVEPVHQDLAAVHDSNEVETEEEQEESLVYHAEKDAYVQPESEAVLLQNGLFHANHFGQDEQVQHDDDDEDDVQQPGASLSSFVVPDAEHGEFNPIAIIHLYLFLERLKKVQVEQTRFASTEINAFALSKCLQLFAKIAVVIILIVYFVANVGFC